MKPGWLFLLLLVGVGCQKPPLEPVLSAPTTAPPVATPTTGAPALAPGPSAPAANPSEKTWKVKPTALSVIKADPPSYLDKPTLVFVMVKPTSYFNYGYNNARNSHFAFEMRTVGGDGRIATDRLFGYAGRSWARPFFDDVNKQLDAGKKGYAPATLVVAYSKKRYDGRSADHIEILAAGVGEKFDMDPAASREASGPPSEAAPKTRGGGDCAWFNNSGARIPHCATYPAGHGQALAEATVLIVQANGGVPYDVRKLGACVAMIVESTCTFQASKKPGNTCEADAATKCNEFLTKN